MSKFAVSGRFQSRDGFSEFQTTVEAPNEKVAHERVYANIGSQHGLKRTQIEIDDVAEAEEVTAA
ncbi:50S ribosomal protein L18Ae [Halobellus ordinarius]|uniref:50S ribosomal protein L18Ae n=1 Tax=Halobellus ordinarius TaxID=3075120 RepID=UPI00288081E2|nr:50S ribosomal protein L18Ae [Halobellus sp. ZY16]